MSIKKLKSIGNGKVTKYIEEKATYYLLFSFSCMGFVIGFFLGSMA